MSREGTSFKEEKKDYLIGLRFDLCPVREQVLKKKRKII
jgi:hypothetical protein